MDAIKLNGLGSLFDTHLTSEISPVLSDTKKTSNNSEEITKIIDNLNHSLNQLNTTLRFSVDTESNVFYVAVVDTTTDEILRRFPLEELPSSTTIHHQAQGIFLNTKG